jgi:transketolase
MDAYQRRAEALGCAAVVIVGHDIAQIDRALAAARDAERPTVVLAQTVKTGISRASLVCTSARRKTTRSTVARLTIPPRPD